MCGEAVGGFVDGCDVDDCGIVDDTLQKDVQ